MLIMMRIMRVMWLNFFRQKVASQSVQPYNETFHFFYKKPFLTHNYNEIELFSQQSEIAPQIWLAFILI